MVEYERFRGKKIEKRGGKTNKYEDCHPESQEMEGSRFLLPLTEGIGARMREAVLRMMT